jgi:hypothetical protein
VAADRKRPAGDAIMPQLPAAAGSPRNVLLRRLVAIASLIWISAGATGKVSRVELKNKRPGDPALGPRSQRGTSDIPAMA